MVLAKPGLLITGVSTSNLEVERCGRKEYEWSVKPSEKGKFQKKQMENRKETGRENKF